MRWVSILSAAVVGAVLYAFIIERDRLQAIAGAESQSAAKASAASEWADPRPAQSIVDVVVLRSTAREVGSGIVLRGRTEAERRVIVLSETTGRVISEPLRRGARVETDDLLCKLDPGTRLAMLEEAEARYREAEANATASERLSERGYTAETTAIANRAALQAAQAAIEQAKLEIERLEIHAPFGGLIESDTAEFGALLQPGSECATIIDLDPIKFVGFVAEQAVDRIKPGAPVTVRLVTGQEFQGKITFVSYSADPDTRTFRVEADIPNAALQIRDGLTAEGVVVTEEAMAHLVPQSALTLDDAGRLGLRLVEDGTARFAPVEVIRDTETGILLSGLPDEIDVIVTGQDYVTDGEPVAVTYAERRP
jgi:membrane fusion protein, multidrug efflux system